MTYFVDGAPISLGRQLGKGAEGAVYAVLGSSKDVAKIYLQAISAVRAEKLTAMLSLASPGLASVSAWPTKIVTDRSGRPTGFLMPFMAGSKDIHAIYNPKSRVAEFPKADWRMLLRVATNTARAFAALHSANCLVGDVNHGGVRVFDDATVKLIDCDSFQVSKAGKVFRCEVGVDNFTPPELQGVTFREVTRSQNHDSFGLAVLIFQILMMGRHPFAGRFSGSGDMPIAKAIKEFRYAYSSDASRTGMLVPPNVVPVMTASQSIVRLWEEAFGPRGPNGVRPPAHQWVQALTAAEGLIQKCPSSPTHYFLAGTGSCPWCPIERRGVLLFGVPYHAGPQVRGERFVLETTWAQIRSISPPRSVQAPVAVPTVSASAEAVAARSRRSSWLIGGWVAGVIIFLLGSAAAGLWFLWLLVGWGMGSWVASRGRGVDVADFRRRHDAAKAGYSALVSKWNTEASSSPFDAELRKLQECRENFVGLADERARRLQTLVANRRSRELYLYLDKFDIDNATISGVGPGKKAMLESFGIDSAADVTTASVMQVPGIGPKTAANLVAWRRGVEARFRFDPQSQLDPRLVAELDREMAAKRDALESELRQGPGKLNHLRTTIEHRRQVLAHAIQQAAEELGSAKADLAAVA